MKKIFFIPRGQETAPFRVRMNFGRLGIPPKGPRALARVGSICFLSSVLCLLSSVCFAQAISSTELIGKAKEYDNVVIIYEGEPVGSILRRGDFAWLNINDGSSAIGVWLPKDKAESVKYMGGYKHKGDWVSVTGVFHRACPEHGGGLDIHAQELTVVKTGEVVNEVIPRRKILWLGILSGVLSCLLIIHILVTKRSSR